MKKLTAILAIIVVVLTIGLSVAYAASPDRICSDRCSMYTEPETFGPCYNDCMREFEN